MVCALLGSKIYHSVTAKTVLVVTEGYIVEPKNAHKITAYSPPAVPESQRIISFRHALRCPRAYIQQTRNVPLPGD